MKESRYNIWLDRGASAYVYNGMTGGLLGISKAEYRALQEFLADPHGACCPEEVVEQLARGRMLVNDEFDELRFLSRKYEASRADRTRFGLTLVTSLGCNFDCPYCFEAKHPSLMEPSVQQMVLQVLEDQLPRIKSFNVTWYGGEPLVGKKPLLALSDLFIERCARAGVDYDARIVTNGSLLSETTCKQLQDRQIKSVQVTLDGPPDVHDRMRPFSSGRGSFWSIVTKLRAASNYLNLGIRVNVDLGNFDRVEELLEILVRHNLAGRVSLSLGQIVGVADNPSAPSANYGLRHECFTKPAFARAELRFRELAVSYGFPAPALPTPIGTPCTAVRANELVVGSKGELYKCWDSVGNPLEVIGHIKQYKDTNGRLQKWLKYDPFSNEECRGCIALPVCMGGCAHHAMETEQYENRCGIFRHTYREQVLAAVARGEEQALARVSRPGELAYVVVSDTD